MALETALETYMVGAIHPLGMAAMPHADLLLKVSVAAPSAETKVMFLAGTAGNARAGIVPFRAHFIVCHVLLGGGDDPPFEIELSRQPCVQVRRPLSFCSDCDVGMFEHVMHVDIAADVLADGRASIVTIAKQKHAPIRGDAFLVEGDDEHTPPAIIDLDSLAVDGEDQDFPADHCDAEPEPNSEPDVDWNDIGPSRRQLPKLKQRRSGVSPAPEQIAFLEDEAAVACSVGLDANELQIGGGSDSDSKSDDSDSIATDPDIDNIDNIDGSDKNLENDTVGQVAADSPAAAAADPAPTAGNCLTALSHVVSLQEMQELLPDFTMNYRPCQLQQIRRPPPRQKPISISEF